ncbi:ABC transporter permease [Paenibacillus pectinilyticus]|uniref:ABC transporter permease n=1 Tax=Paenibacillus pectinilyticus TaxID=512399 RepID=A0A1C0ZZ47_9BACL|nr:carbohydrate ABC transporter permease [Paenibacillus pectinilyticus]OCT13412.1 ABC transporter permease [Paenibacillus pectinilyticus]
MRIRRTQGEIWFDRCNVAVLSLACLLMIIPLLNVLASSLSSTDAMIHAEVRLWPVDMNFDNYRTVLGNAKFWHAFGISLFIVTVGTFINLAMTVLTAYPLSKSYLRGRKVVLIGVLFTMIFQPPMIPTYLVVKQFGLINSVWAMIIPLALSAFNLLIGITFFRSLPEPLFEAARVDGVGEFTILFRIVIPLSMPIMVTLLLFYAVGNWNNYYTALLYINNAALHPLQLYLYYVIAQFNMNEAMSKVIETTMDVSPQGLQMATIIVATVPILIVYPFLQKHFIRGAMIGSIKE